LCQLPFAVIGKFAQKNPGVNTQGFILNCLFNRKEWCLFADILRMGYKGKQL
jgi:hypothetical protein